MPSKEKCKHVKTVTELGKDLNWKNHIRVIKPPGDETNDVLGITHLPIHQRRGIRIVPPREILFPPEPKKVTLIKQRSRDRNSIETKRCLAPDGIYSPETDLALKHFRTAKILSGRAKCEMDSSRVRIIMGNTLTPSDDNLTKLLRQNADVTKSETWAGSGTTKRRPPIGNDSSGVKKLLFRWNPEEHSKTQNAIKQMLPCRKDYYKNSLGNIMGTSVKDEIVWQPGRRLAYQFLTAKGFHATKWEDDSLQRLLNKQRRSLTYNHHHWKSSIFGNSAPEPSIITNNDNNKMPYVYHNILWGGPNGVVYHFGKRCRSSEDIRNPVTGECFSFKRGNSGDNSTAKEKLEKIDNANSNSILDFSDNSCSDLTKN